MKYLACFQGKERGAIGKSSYFNITVEADDEEAARLKLYDTHEHIERLILLYRGKQTVCKHSPEDVARCGTHYVSTYNGESWLQDDCRTYASVEKTKAAQLRRLEERYPLESKQ